MFSGCRPRSGECPGVRYRLDSEELAWERSRERPRRPWDRPRRAPTSRRRNPGVEARNAQTKSRLSSLPRQRTSASFFLAVYGGGRGTACVILYTHDVRKLRTQRQTRNRTKTQALPKGHSKGTDDPKARYMLSPDGADLTRTTSVTTTTDPC